MTAINMKKSELATELAGRTGLNKTAANAVLTAFTEIVSEALAKGKGSKVQLTGLGTFTVRERKARNGVNPSSGAKIQIPAKRVAAFKASSSLAEKVA